MAESWKFLGGPGANQDYELSFATGRKLTFSQWSPWTCTWTVDGRDARAVQIQEFSDDLKVFRGSELIFRGIISITDDTVGPTHTVSMRADSYKEKLRHRLVKDHWALNAFNTDPGVQGLSFIFLLQLETNGSEGIAPGTVEASALQDLEWNVGEPVADVIDRWARQDGGGNPSETGPSKGFDWDISPDMTYNVWNPARGSIKQQPLDWGGAVMGVQRRLRQARFANAVLGMGSGFLVPEYLETPGLAADSRGKWETTVSWPDVMTQEEQDGRTQYLLDQVSEREFEYTLQLKQGWWEGPSQLWVGDKVPFILNSGRLSINENLIVESLQVSLDESGVETVEVTVA